MLIFDDGYYDAYVHALPIMQKYNYVGIIPLILAQLDESDYLTGKNVRTLQNFGWEIANHTWNHSILTEKDKTQLYYQITQSKHDLEKWF
jgi:peptidoglycan/xylan/chitin deacetylase (PgdA/CDA1 family)